MDIKFTKILTIAALVLAFNVSKAQVHYSEGFENFTKVMEEWTFYDGDSDGVNFMVNGQYPHSGSSALEAYSWTSFTQGLKPENYAISPLIDLSALTSANSPVYLTYWHVAPHEEWDLETYKFTILDQGVIENLTVDSLGVELIDTIDVSRVRDIANLGFDLKSIPSMAGINEYEQLSFDITDKIGTKFFLVFKHYDSDNQWEFMIDDIRIAEPIKYDAAYAAFDYENDYRLGSIPFYLFDSIPVTACVTNLGTKSFTDVDITVVGGAGQGSNVVETYSTGGVLNAQVDPDETWCWKGNVGINVPLATGFVTVDRVTVSINDSFAELDISNNYDSATVQPSMVNLSTNYYSTLDSANFASAPDFNPMEVYISDGQPTSIYVDYSDPEQDFTFVGDRFTEMGDFITRDPNTGELNKAVLYGVRYDVKPSDSSAQAILQSVHSLIGPAQAGGLSWVEIYDYYNWTNTVGDTVEPLWTSKDSVYVQFGWNNDKAHTLVHNFGENYPAPVLGSGKYIVCVAEGGHDEDNSIGMLGMRADRYNGNVNDNTSYIGWRDSEDKNLMKTEVDNLFCDAQGRCSDYQFPISLIVKDTSGARSINPRNNSAFWSIEEKIDLNGLVNLYPNPATNTLNISIDASFKAKTVVLKDITGRTIKTIGNLNGLNIVSINMSSLHSGIYIVEISNTEGTATKKLIKQ